jgi:hypothetical protein
MNLLIYQDKDSVQWATWVADTIVLHVVSILYYPYMDTALAPSYLYFLHSLGFIWMSYKLRQNFGTVSMALSYFLGRKSNLAVENKLLIYKTIIIPIWILNICSFVRQCNTFTS